MLFILRICLVLCGFITSASRLDIDVQVKEMVAQMSLEQKIGQMMQLNIDSIMKSDRVTLDESRLRYYLKNFHLGSILNSPFAGGPRAGKYGWKAKEWRQLIHSIQRIAREENVIPLIYGIDSVHGAVYVQNAVYFGQQINAASTFNPELVYKMGHITGKDTAAAGISWIFAPILGISTSQKWPRVYETFGEDPLLASVLGKQLIKGIQSNKNVAACMKHFIAYSKPLNGNDRDDVVLSDYDLLNYYAPSFIAAQEAGVLSAMEGYNSINGEPVVSSHKYLVKLLRKDMGFKGMLVTDWAEINNLFLFHRIASSKKDAARVCLRQSSVDMSMLPTETNFFQDVLQLVQEGHVSEERIAESVERIVQLKFTLGMFNEAVPGAEQMDSVGSESDKEIALELARESIVLLKNKNSVLPLENHRSNSLGRKRGSILLTGDAADSIGHLCGGWSVAWKGLLGNDRAFAHGSSIKKAMNQLIQEKRLKFQLETATKRRHAIEMAKHSDYTIVVIGEKPYAEKDGDITDLSMDEGQLEFARQLTKTRTKVILVLVEGRPRLLHGVANIVHAVLHAFLPCEMGGQAIAEIVFGVINPSGRMPLTYSKDEGNIDIPYYRRTNTQCPGGKACEMQWKFGEGMSYTDFSYGNMHLDKKSLKPGDALSIQVTITNKGTRSGKETVLLFLSDPVRSFNVPEVKLLKGFQKVFLNPGESQRLTFTLTSLDLSVYLPNIGNGLHRVTEAGSYFVSFGYDTTCGLYAGSHDGLCHEFFVLEM